MELRKPHTLELEAHDALVVVDVQNDFLPGGSLAVPHGEEVVPVLNRYLSAFHSRRLAIYATRDWHPPEHCSFKAQGGIWPPHCVAETLGAQFASDLGLPPETTVISKATELDKDAYSGFEGTDLDARLRDREIKRLFIGGLATDYCVLNTVKDAIKHGYEVLLLEDAIRAVNVNPDDGLKAEETMQGLGARPIHFEILATRAPPAGSASPEGVEETEEA
ncbi:MAG: nicotinamidase [Gammaproteobacteria bacterium]|nr:MAG: nicotinamidase [Gammaproteobacteria bacterium]